MNFFEDAVRFFSNMKKEASAKHILIKGSDAISKLTIIKSELVGVEDLSAAFSDLAAKVSIPIPSVMNDVEVVISHLKATKLHINFTDISIFDRLANALAQTEAGIWERLNLE